MTKLQKSDVRSVCMPRHIADSVFRLMVHNLKYSSLELQPTYVYDVTLLQQSIPPTWRSVNVVDKVTSLSSHV